MSYQQNKLKILVTNTELSDPALKILEKHCEVLFLENPCDNRDEIIEKIKGVDGVLWTTHEYLNSEILDAAGIQLKSISTISAGLDHVDIKEIQNRKISLGHTPEVLNNTVAELAIGLMIAAARRFYHGRYIIDNSEWIPWKVKNILGQDIQGSTIGFVGFGGIGQAISKRLNGFDVHKILYTSRRKNKYPEHLNAIWVPFEELLQKSDFVIIACPLTSETKGMFDENAFNLMKKTSILINIARGAIVDQNSLYNALKNGLIYSAGLDVLEQEPIPSDDPLLKLPNCVITPHWGSATYETRKTMAMIAAENVIKGLLGEKMIYPVC